MTTDRPTSTRTTALAQRAYSSAPAGRQPAAPTDAFSAMLGAAAPRTDDAPRSDAPRQRRDDVQRSQRNDAQRPQRSDDPQPKAKPAAKPADEQPTAEAPAQEPTTEEPAEGAPRPMTADIFALQLASPLPPTPVAATPTGAPVPGTAVPAEGEGDGRNPRVPFAQPAQRPRSDAAGHRDADPEAPTPGAKPRLTPGGIPLPFLAGLATEAADRPAKIELPTELPTADAATPQLDHGRCRTERGRRAVIAGLRAAAAQPAGGPERRCADEQARRRAGPGRHDAAAHPGRPGGAARGHARAHRPAARDSALPAPESAAQLIQIAADRGITHAKLNLKPVELGGIEVRLKIDAAGRHRPPRGRLGRGGEAADQAADDLRRDLEERDVNLLSLDVSTQQQHQKQQAGRRSRPTVRRLPDRGRRAEPRVGPQRDEGLTETAVPAETTLVLPNGVHVDVLA